MKDFSLKRETYPGYYNKRRNVLWINKLYSGRLSRCINRCGNERIIFRIIWKRLFSIEEKYVFTNKELQVAVGYSENTKLANSIMSNILESLSREGIIKFVDFYETGFSADGVEIPTPKKRLIFVAQTKEDLQK